MAKTISKVPVVHEDIAIGAGIVSQTRNNESVSVRQIELSWVFRTIAEIRGLDITKYTRVSLHKSLAATEYWYDASSTEDDDSLDVLKPDSIDAGSPGRWVIAVLDRIVMERIGEADATPFVDIHSIVGGETILQMWIGPDGGAIFSGAVEVRNFEDQDDFTYSLYTTENVVGVDGAGVLTPAKNIEDGVTTWYSARFHIDTNSTSGSNTNINRFTFTEDGNFESPNGILADNWVRVEDSSDSIVNGYQFYCNGFDNSGTDVNQGNISPARTDIHAQLTVASYNNTLDQKYNWFFNQRGDFWCPGDVIINSEYGLQGALEIATIELTNKAYFAFYNTNEQTEEATLVITPGHEIEIDDPGNAEYFSGKVIIQTSPNGSTLRNFVFRTDGDLDIVGVVNEGSDERLKENIVSADQVLAVELLYQDLAKQFDRIDTGKSEWGFIAQQIRGVMPSLISEDENGFLSMAYSKVTAYLWAQNQAQQTRLDDLEARLVALES